MSPEYVFTYGTLRPSLATGAVLRLIHAGVPAGPATVRGRLFDLGAYPALVAGADEVQGELLRVQDEAWLAALDAHEECLGPHPLYRRESWRATRPEGVEVWAWVYVYARPLEGARPIPSGDYREHVRRSRRDVPAEEIAEGA